MKKFGSKDNRLVPRARDLRIQSTDVEKLLWYRLRARQILECKFRRQHPVMGCVLDFACEELRVAVELDGGQHAIPENITADAVRTQRLANSGWVVLRFWNNEVLENMDGVLQVVAAALEARLSLPLTQYSRGEY